MLIELVSYIVK